MLRGYFCLWDVWSDPIGQKLERISPHAFINLPSGINPRTRKPIYIDINHDHKPIGIPNLYEDDVGAGFMFDLGLTSLPDEISGMSFSFVCREGDTVFRYRRSGCKYTLDRAVLTSISIIIRPMIPAYPQTRRTLHLRRED